MRVTVDKEEGTTNGGSTRRRIRSLRRMVEYGVNIKTKIQSGSKERRGEMMWNRTGRPMMLLWPNSDAIGRRLLLGH
jgi:hypothetical protein